MPSRPAADGRRAPATDRVHPVRERPTSRVHHLSGDERRQCLCRRRVTGKSAPIPLLESRLLLQFRALASEIGLFGVGLRADRHELAGRHRHRAREKARQHRRTERSSAGIRRCDADDQARGRNNAIIRAEHSCAQPADAELACRSTMSVQTSHNRGPFVPIGRSASPRSRPSLDAQGPASPQR